MINELNATEQEALIAQSIVCNYSDGEVVFSEGDAANYIYFINKGAVSIYIDQFNTRAVIQTLGIGEIFGEMALRNCNTRTASAITIGETHLLRIAKDDLLALMLRHPDVEDKLNRTLSRRSEELVLREKLLDLSGLDSGSCHIGIKGDPSLRESALTRDRYESSVDRLMSDLVPVLKELLIERSAYRIFVGCNNGEVKVSNIFDPFNEEFHSVMRLVDKGYLDRHFPKIDYSRKLKLVREYYNKMPNFMATEAIPKHLNDGFKKYYESWKPIPAEVISEIIDTFPTLRAIPNFYIRNATITTTKDVIHLQFNCDGTHILSAEGYKSFLEQNL